MSQRAFREVNSSGELVKHRHVRASRACTFPSCQLHWPMGEARRSGTHGAISIIRPRLSARYIGASIQKSIIWSGQGPQHFVGFVCFWSVSHGFRPVFLPPGSSLYFVAVSLSTETTLYFSLPLCNLAWRSCDPPNSGPGRPLPTAPGPGIRRA
jgi:hypothetical protein